MIDHGSDPGAWAEAIQYLTAPTSAQTIALEQRLQARKTLRPHRSKASEQGWATRKHREAERNIKH